MIYVVMGVSGSGKSLIGKKLSKMLGLPFFDGDDFHPDTNVRMMAAGVPLNDENRIPWLNRLAEKIKEWEEEGGAVLACSALKHAYREILAGDGGKEKVRFIYLKGSHDLITGRLSKRDGHFMPPDLLRSQLDALEEPEEAITVEINQSPDRIVQVILEQLSG